MTIKDWTREETTHLVKKRRYRVGTRTGKGWSHGGGYLTKEENTAASLVLIEVGDDSGLDVISTESTLAPASTTSGITQGFEIVSIGLKIPTFLHLKFPGET